MKRIVLVLAALALSGCNTTARGPGPAVTAAADADATCRSYGAVPGSAAYVQCRTAIDQGTANRAQADAAACEQRRANRTAEVDRENAARAGTSLGQLPRPGTGLFGALDRC